MSRKKIFLIGISLLIITNILTEMNKDPMVTAKYNCISDGEFAMKKEIKRITKYPKTLEYDKFTNNYDREKDLFNIVDKFSAKNAFGVHVEHQAIGKIKKNNCKVVEGFFSTAR